MRARGIIGEVRSHKVITGEHDVLVCSEERGNLQREIKGIGEYVSKRIGEIRLGWAQTEDFEILYIYDRRDGFGYAVNLDAPDLSEWGYAPFELDSED